MLALNAVRINTPGPRRRRADQFFGNPLPTRTGADAKTYRTTHTQYLHKYIHIYNIIQEHARA